MPSRELATNIIQSEMSYICMPENKNRTSNEITKQKIYIIIQVQQPSTLT